MDETTYFVEQDALIQRALGYYERYLLSTIEAAGPSSPLGSVAKKEYQETVALLQDLNGGSHR